MSATTLLCLIQSYDLSYSLPTVSNPVINTLFAAVTSSLNVRPSQDRFNPCYHHSGSTEACAYFPPTLVHAGVPRPLTTPRTTDGHP